MGFDPMSVAAGWIMGTAVTIVVGVIVANVLVAREGRGGLNGRKN